MRRYLVVGARAAAKCSSSGSHAFLGSREFVLDSNPNLLLVGAVATACGLVQEHRREISAEAVPKASSDANDLIVVVGGGIIGCTVAQHLRRRDQKVIQLSEDHVISSSWGETRALHFTMSDPLYFRMNSFNLREFIKLEGQYAVTDTTSEPLLFHTGRALVGPQRNVERVRDLINDTALEGPHGFKAKSWEFAWKAKDGVPIIQIPDDCSNQQAVYTDGGFTLNAGSILNFRRALLEEDMVKHGGSESAPLPVRSGHSEKVVGIDRAKKVISYVMVGDDSDGQVVRELKYSKLILCAGVWTNELLDAACLSRVPLRKGYEQTVNFGFKEGCEGRYSADALGFKNVSMPEGSRTRSQAGAGEGPVQCGSMPLLTVWMGTYSEGDYAYIVPPVHGSHAPGIKVGLHMFNKIWDEDETELERLNPELLQRQQEVAARYLPGVDIDKVQLWMRCLYQITSDGQFIVGAHPQDEDVILACGFNGHGFQQSPAVAELVCSYAACGAEFSSELPPEVLAQMREKFKPARCVDA